LGLTFDRLDFEKQVITIDRQLSRQGNKVFENHLKTSKSYRSIRFPRVLQELIVDHVATFGLGPEDLLFSNRAGKIWRYKDAAAMYRKVVTPLGIPKGDGLHQLRHAFVSTLIALGGNAKQIQDWVGHEKITETMDVYGHLFPNSLNELSEKLDRFATEQNFSMNERKMLA
jgi:integrase